MTIPVAPSGGIDWATDSNELCIIDPVGQVLRRMNTATDAAGIRRLLRELERHSVARVAIERPDGPVVEALLAVGIEVVVITPRQVKNLRSRYGSAGNKDDRFDAFVLADTLRTDPGRLVALQPDTPQTLALRSAVRARTDLVETRIALCNQLRAHLHVVFTDNKTHQHATRILARAWRVIWRCWQDSVAYDPALHGGAQRHLTQAA